MVVTAIMICYLMAIFEGCVEEEERGRDATGTFFRERKRLGESESRLVSVKEKTPRQTSRGQKECNERRTKVE
jgi:hypothetical protein